MPVMAEESYSPSEAARVLSRSGHRIGERRVRQMAAAGEIEATRETGGWRIPRREVHRLLEDRRERRELLEDSGSPSGSPTEDPELLERLLDAERRAARSEARLELTEQTESTLREQLTRERERADRLEGELADARRAVEVRTPWWRRWFGG